MKGSSGQDESCIITAGEVRQANENSKCVVWIVTEVLLQVLTAIAIQARSFSNASR